MFARNAMSSVRRLVTDPAGVRGYKVAVCGAAGGIGQPLSSLLKLTGRVDHLSLYDVRGAKGVAADIGHIDRKGDVTGHVGPEELDEALDGCDVVVIPAGVPRKPGMTRDDLFAMNAGIVQGLVSSAAKNCPNAALLIISNPVNSTVPIAAETLKRAGVYDPRKLFGVTTLDVTRANRFMAGHFGEDPASYDVTVVGGHAGITILPLLSRLPRYSELSDEDVAALTHRIQFGGDEVVQAKDGAGSATLSMAWAGAHMTEQVLRGFDGESGVMACSFVESSVTDAPFFSTPVELGKDGVAKIHEVGPMSAFEQENFDKMIPDLIGSIEKGVEFANAN